jgi:hypothetical protein
MWDQVIEFIEFCFSGANLPASVLLCAAMVYWSFMILVGLDLDLFDFDLDFDSQPDFESAASLGLVVLRFLNIGRVPIMIWGSVFTITFWLTSTLMDRFLDQGLFEDPTQRWQWMYVLQFCVRNLAISVVLTKAFTHPLRDKFDAPEPNKIRDLIGTTCVIKTSEVTEKFGQAEYKTDAAPLLLNVRVADAKDRSLAKGDTAVIVDFDPEMKIYLVQKTDS